jgi:hypothetical protein
MYIDRLTPNVHYSDRTAPLNSRRCILNIYAKNIRTEYLKSVAVPQNARGVSIIKSRVFVLCRKIVAVYCGLCAEQGNVLWGEMGRILK